MLLGDFSNKNILVVGASTGAGRELLSRLTGAGARVTVWGRHEPSGTDPAGYGYSPVDATRALAEQNPQVPDPLHGVVYCPGTLNLGSFARLTEEQFLADFNLNALGAVRVLQHCLRSFAPTGASVVLFSTVAVQLGLTFHASVAAAKGAVEGLVRALAAELAPKRIRVNAVADQRHPLGREAGPDDGSGGCEPQTDPPWTYTAILVIGPPPSRERSPRATGPRASPRPHPQANR
jgi:NAD(P)-dependent dehydrogenase (short-subunit alcohol dehydrogenase family)